MKKYHLWLILGAYGAWFATVSGIEEVLSGKYWKVVISLVLAVIVYVWIENRKN